MKSVISRIRDFVDSGRDSVPRPEVAIRAREEFYPQVESCQIPNLNVIYERFLGCRDSGVFVEVGANDGVYVSNSWGLAEHGWRGFLIEPVPEFAAAARRNHANHPDVTIIEKAVTSPGVPSVTLQLAGALTTGREEVFDEYRTIDWAQSSLDSRIITVPAATLDEALVSEGVQSDFDVLIVDVEGLEGEVLSGFSVSNWRPKLMIWELADLHPDITTTATEDEHVLSSLINAGYRIAYKDHINTVFVRTDVWSQAWGREPNLR